MKPYPLILSAALLCSACGSSQMVSGDPGAVFAGASIGGNVGSALGGLIGGSTGGWRGSYNGSAIGTIVGTLAGAAIGNAMTTPKESRQETVRDETYYDNREENYTEPAEVEEIDSPLGALKIQRMRFIDDNRNHVVESEESGKIIFEIMNEGNRAAHNVVPVVSEVSGMKRIGISPSVMIEEILPHGGVKYTATLRAGKRIKTGEMIIRIAVTDEYGQEYDWQEFTLPTQR